MSSCKVPSIVVWF